MGVAVTTTVVVFVTGGSVVVVVFVGDVVVAHGLAAARRGMARTVAKRMSFIAETVANEVAGAGVDYVCWATGDPAGLKARFYALCRFFS